MEIPIRKAKLKRGIERMGFVPMWLVDDDGNQINTEPVCTIPIEYHKWFIDWLEFTSQNWNWPTI